jgi:hypothetical protein
MRGTILYGPRDIRFEDRPEPAIVEPTDAIIRMSATCCAGRTSGPTAVSTPCQSRRLWGMSTAASSRRSAALSARSSPASS